MEVRPLPLYEYLCPACGRFEVIRRFSDPPLKACPTCRKRIRKLASAPAIQFKGAGWYVNDYAKKPASDASKGDGAAVSASGSETSKTGSTKAESAKSESTKAESAKSDAAPRASTPKGGSAGSGSSK